MLDVQNISKVLGDDEILTRISLTLNPGQSIAITGNSGSGKTTLLTIIGLLQAPGSGAVWVNGVEATTLGKGKQAKLRGNYFGFVFQRARLVSSLTALENVMLPAQFMAKGKKLSGRARELLVNFGMEHRLNHKPQELSLGQLRRVSLARALLLEPPILLADEPTNDLDPELARSVADTLFQARDNGVGVIIVTHDPELAARADEVRHLEQGALQRVNIRSEE